MAFSFKLLWHGTQIEHVACLAAEKLVPLLVQALTKFGMRHKGQDCRKEACSTPTHFDTFDQTLYFCFCQKPGGKNWAQASG